MLHQYTCEQCGQTFSRAKRKGRSSPCRFCSHTCVGNAQRRPDFEPTPSDIERVWSRIDQSGGPDACWPWIRGTDTGGYGLVRWRGRNARATRIIWELTHGLPLPPMVCHACDNPRCCNPVHHFACTAGENSRDAAKKGRLPHGSGNAQARLTDEQVREIRSVYVRMSRTLGAESLGRKYGVSGVAILRIVKGKGWRHLLN